eukprot:Em0004g307a
MCADEEERRPVFGNRHLDDPSSVFEHNAWDNVQWDEEQQMLAEQKVKDNSSAPLSNEQAEVYEKEAGVRWTEFYRQHQNKFFKDRHWLFTEFPELMQPVNSEFPEGTQAHQLEREKFVIFEVGCGVGNTVFPILQTNRSPNLFIYCCDFADSAVQLVKEHELYDAKRCHAFQCDITDSSHQLPVPPGSVDVIILIFVLSALHPSKMQDAMDRLVGCLKPGGLLLFRDYGRYDMAQLRFKKGQCLSDNFYVRGDGTRVYFFSEEDVSNMLTRAGLTKEQLYVDRRLQVNRGRQLRMYRVWIQAKFRKPRACS